MFFVFVAIFLYTFDCLSGNSHQPEDNILDTNIYIYGLGVKWRGESRLMLVSFVISFQYYYIAVPPFFLVATKRIGAKLNRKERRGRVLPRRRAHVRTSALARTYSFRVASEWVISSYRSQNDSHGCVCITWHTMPPALYFFSHTTSLHKAKRCTLAQIHRCISVTVIFSPRHV